MRHRKAGSKFNRNSSHRKAMFRNMVTSLLKHDRIRTTDAKAKELRSWADHLITLAKRGDLHARRQAMAIVREKDVVHKLFEEAAERFNDVAGGYTRVIKVDRRPGDAATMSIIELVSPEAKSKKKKKIKPKAAPKSTPAEDQKEKEADVPVSAETADEAADEAGGADEAAADTPAKDSDEKAEADSDAAVDK